MESTWPTAEPLHSPVTSSAEVHMKSEIVSTNRLFFKCYKMWPSFTDTITFTCNGLFKAKPWLLFFIPAEPAAASTESVGRFVFMVTSSFLFNHSGFFLCCRQHASTNATMVFEANCDVHYFLCCLILFKKVIFSLH